MRTTNKTNLDRFFGLYGEALERVIREHADEYRYGVDEVPSIAAKMRAAFENGSYNHDGRAIAATCKALGIGKTRKAIETFILEA